jgi:hypothetical protein
MPGEHVILVGIGRTRGEQIEVDMGLYDAASGWKWGEGRKLWGTNVTAGWPREVRHGVNVSRVLTTTFSNPLSESATEHEAQAATGDSGGALFALRNPTDPEQGWALAGVMSTVSGLGARPEATSLYGDLTYSIDLSHYRDQIIALVRPACSNDVDDDGDGRIDYPADRDCDSMADDDESSRDSHSGAWPIATATAAAIMLVLVMAGTAAWLRSKAKRLQTD